MILNGDCIVVLRDISSNSVDAVVTDPPYGLAFMGKKWDYDVPSVEIWKEVLRVLKPGGHLLSFGGTRTYHRMVVNIEDAGFEIRDQLQWLHGMGFPKSHDISKAIDKLHGAVREVVGQSRDKKYSAEGVTSGASIGGVQGGHNFQSQFSITAPATEDAKRWQGWGSALKPANEPICMARKPLEKGLTIAENVLRYGTGALNIDATRIKNRSWEPEQGLSNSNAENADGIPKQGQPEAKGYTAQQSAVTTDESKAFPLHGDECRAAIGCSSGLCPAEHGVARKGCSSSNIEPCGKNTLGKSQKASSFTTSTTTHSTTESKICASCPEESMLSTISKNTHQTKKERLSTPAEPAFAGQQGRFPSNVLLDEASSELIGEPARFFYCAKASKSERNAGLEGMPKKVLATSTGQTRPGSPARLGADPHSVQEPVANHHPTVKPLKLMEYLIKLITPPGGIVLDPFAGSGTTLVAAKKLGFGYVGIEREREYCEISEKRLEAV